MDTWTDICHCSEPLMALPQAHQTSKIRQVKSDKRKASERGAPEEGGAAVPGLLLIPGLGTVDLAEVVQREREHTPVLQLLTCAAPVSRSAAHAHRVQGRPRFTLLLL